jgi:hypothetical protein
MEIPSEATLCPSQKRATDAPPDEITKMIAEIFKGKPTCKTSADSHSDELMATYKAKASAGYGAAKVGVSAGMAASYLDTKMTSEGCTSTNVFSNKVKTLDESTSCNMLNTMLEDTTSVSNNASITVRANCTHQTAAKAATAALALESYNKAVALAFSMNVSGLDAQQAAAKIAMGDKIVAYAAATNQEAIEALNSPCASFDDSTFIIDSSTKVSSVRLSDTDLENELKQDYDMQLTLAAKSEVQKSLGFQSVPDSVSTIINAEIENAKTESDADIKNIVENTSLSATGDNKIIIDILGGVEFKNTVLSITTAIELAQEQAKILAAKKGKEVATKVLLDLSSDTSTSTDIAGADDMKKAQADVIKAMGEAMPPELDLGGGMVEMIIGAIILLIILAVGGYFAYQYMQK